MKIASNINSVTQILSGITIITVLATNYFTTQLTGLIAALAALVILNFYFLFIDKDYIKNNATLPHWAFLTISLVVITFIIGRIAKFQVFEIENHLLFILAWAFPITSIMLIFSIKKILESDNRNKIAYLSSTIICYTISLCLLTFVACRL